MPMRSSSLANNPLAITREMDGRYDVVLQVRDNLGLIEQVAGVDFATILAELESAQDFTGITVVQGETVAWYAVNKVLTVPKGDKGDKGDTGLTGDTGSQGIQGLQGIKGDTGLTGDTGSQGIQGFYGEDGAQGPKGDTGDDLTITQITYNGNGTFNWLFSDGTTYVTPDLRGSTGAAGPQGVKGDTGIGVHHLKGTSTTQLEGDFGIAGETDTYTFYADAGETIPLGWFVVTNGMELGDVYTKAEADALHDSLAVASAGQSVSYFLDNVITPGGNYALTNSPDGDPETTIAKIAVAANTPYFMERYISDPIGDTAIDGGLWVFRTYARVSSDVGTSEIISRINKRTIKSGTVTITGTGTSRTITSSDPIFVFEDANSSVLNATLIETPTETFWISAFTSATQVTAITDNSGYINETSVSIHMYYKLFEATTGDINGNTAKLYETKSIQPSFNIVPTDSILIAYFAITTSTNKTLTLYKGGTVNYSHIVTPIVYRHNSLKGLNEGEFQHLTTAQLAKINAISGTNTGDQTITLTGDITGTGTGSFATALSNTGVSAGTYKLVTVDLKGRITSGTNPTTISGFGISDAYTKTEIDLVVGDINSALDTINGQVI